LKYLKKIIEENRQGTPKGIYSVCSAHPLVIEAAMEHAKEEKTPLLIEATANQVNQFGGYTGMRAEGFYDFVCAIALKVGFPLEHIILGGDHLGPVCWSGENSSDAMDKADDLIKEYVAAGFKKIHLDCSMECADDNSPLSDEIIAMRAARLCKIAEHEALKRFGESDILYVIGTEVPPPGGTNEELTELEVTSPEHALRTLNVHKIAFKNQELNEAWSRVIGIVVQPGVEFSHTSIVQYQPDKAAKLKGVISSEDNIVFEAHSTDYQLPENYKRLVEDHFAILKVGPQLTYAMREALYALHQIEKYLVNQDDQSNLYETCEREMMVSPKNWQKFYSGSKEEEKLLRHFSYSDRIRYYWPNKKVEKAVRSLIDNLSDRPIPLPLLSQYMPEQNMAVLEGKLKNKPKELIKAKIKTVLKHYSSACYRKH
jgi:D-tagatose-1,6-bisphosphate aldolase subunit GatZ/KbaZ